MSDDLDRLDKLAEAATPGPWEADLTDPSVWGPERIIFGNYTMNDGFDSPGWEDGTSSDIEFIAAANPTVVRALVQQVRDAVAERDAALEVMNAHKCEESAERAYRRAVRAESERDAALAAIERVRAEANAYAEQPDVMEPCGAVAQSILWALDADGKETNE